MATAMTTRASKKSAPVSRVLRQRAERILAESYAFMDSPLFKKRSIEQELFAVDPEPELPATAWYQATAEDLDSSTPNTPKLMNASEERLMFLRFNYSKKRLLDIQKKAKKGELTTELAEQAILWHRRFEHFREYLVRTNLALVLAMAKRTRLGRVDFAEIVSEGNMALLRAVDKFNVERGFKFSTYACRAILKAFSRTALNATRYHTRFPVEVEPDRRREQVEEECIDELKTIVDRNLADLSSVEQTVIRRRFNWEQHDDSGLTLEEVGKIIGVTKERVRQIQNKALAKIRQVMEDGVLRMVPDQAAADPGAGI